MSKFNEDAIDEVVAAAAMKQNTPKAEEAPVVAKEEEAPVVVPEEEQIQKQTPIYGIPKSWAKLVKKHRHATFSTYARAAIEEKMIRDGLL